MNTMCIGELMDLYLEADVTYISVYDIDTGECYHYGQYQYMPLKYQSKTIQLLDIECYADIPVLEIWIDGNEKEI